MNFLYNKSSAEAELFVFLCENELNVFDKIAFPQGKVVKSISRSAFPRRKVVKSTSRGTFPRGKVVLLVSRGTFLRGNVTK